MYGECPYRCRCAYRDISILDDLAKVCQAKRFNDAEFDRLMREQAELTVCLVRNGNPKAIKRVERMLAIRNGDFKALDDLQ